MLRNKKLFLRYIFEPENRLFIGGETGRYATINQTVYLHKQQVFDVNGTLKDVYVYPASSLKGKLRSNFKTIIQQLSDINLCKNCDDVNSKEVCPVCDFLGSSRKEGRMYFSNPVYCTNFTVRETTGVTIDRRRGVAEDKKLYTYEHIEDVVLKGEIYIYLADGEQKDQKIQWFILALLSLNNLGGKKSTGLGKGSFKIDYIEFDGNGIENWENILGSLRGGQ